MTCAQRSCSRVREHPSSPNCQLDSRLLLLAYVLIAKWEPLDLMGSALKAIDVQVRTKLVPVQPKFALSPPRAGLAELALVLPRIA